MFISLFGNLYYSSSQDKLFINVNFSAILNYSFFFVVESRESRHMPHQRKVQLNFEYSIKKHIFVDLPPRIFEARLSSCSNMKWATILLKFSIIVINQIYNTYHPKNSYMIFAAFCMYIQYV